MGKIAEIVGATLCILAVQAWCAAWVFGGLRMAQLVGAERDTPAGRMMMVMAAMGGFGAALWLVWRGMRHLKSRAHQAK